MLCPECGSDCPEGGKFCGCCGAPLPSPGPAAESPTAVLPGSPARELEPGTTFARRYQVIESLGQGGMGRVYKVFDTAVREKLALKLLSPEIAADEPTIERFRNEIKLARTVSHRNVCRMHDLGLEEGAYFITMEYVPGEDLKSLIRRIGALPLGKAVAVARQVCDGLEEAHRVGVVHRDLKPQNIMIDREGNVRIMDFGIARSVRGKGLTGPSVVIGTPEYMSPEQVDGREADRRSDVYSLGIVLFEMVTGQLPFSGDTPMSVAVKQKSEPPPDPRAANPQVPEALARLVLRCLDKARERRPQSAAELSSELARLQASLPATMAVTPSARRPATARSITLRLPAKRVWVPAAAVLVAAAAFTVWQFVPEREGTRRSIAVLGFRNQTGDAAFDYLQETIPNLLITSLEQSGRFRVTTWQRLKDLLRQSGKGPASLVDEEAGFDVCRREGIEALAVGFYTRAGDTFVTDVKVLDTATRQPLRTSQSRGDGPGSILKTQIDQISREVCRGASRPPLKIAKAPPRVGEVTTSSLQAYNLFLRGRDQWDRFLYADARTSLEAAVSLDPTFAAAWFYLSRVAGEMSEFRLREDALRKARKNAARATEKERLYIEAFCASVIDGNPEKRRLILTDIIRRFPTEKTARFELALYYGARLRLDDALRELQAALALDPEFGPGLNQMAFIHARRGDVDAAIADLRRYAALNPEDPNPKDSMGELSMQFGRLREAAEAYAEALRTAPDFYVAWRSLAYVSALREDYPEALRCLDQFEARAPSAGARTEARWQKAFYRYLLGQWDGALADFRAVRESALDQDSEAMRASTDWITAFLLLDRGEPEPAGRRYRAWSAWAAKADPAVAAFHSFLDLAFAASVDLARRDGAAASAALGRMKARLGDIDPGNRDRARFLHGLLTAEAALAAGKPDEAIAAGEGVPVPILPTLRTVTMAAHNIPFLKDAVARARWRKGDLDGAAAEYRNLMTVGPGTPMRFLISPLYHYRLGRVLEQKGDGAGARAEYGKFLDYWKDADASHPELADARKRLAGLK